MTDQIVWNKAGYERGAYWARSISGLKGFTVESKPGQSDDEYQAARRQAQRSRDVWIRNQNKG